MPEFSKIAYYDLRLEVLEKRLGPIVGRAEEMERITRIMNRRLHNNCLIVAPSGSGKTSLIRGWAEQAISGKEFEKIAFVEFEAESFEALHSTGVVPLGTYKEALEALPRAIIFFDNFGRLVHNKPALLHYMVQLFRPLAEEGKIQLLLTMDMAELKWIEAQQPNFLHYFETMSLSAQAHSEQLTILQQKAALFTKKQEIKVEEATLELILKLVERFSVLGQLPSGAVAILDESLALGRNKKRKLISEEEVYRVVSDKINIPLSQLQVSDKELLKTMEQDLNKRVIGQKPAIAAITSTIQRAKLGLKNPNRPLGSFLLLGPSGVGKTETAKLVAERVFGRKENFVRIDMSEFGEAHTVARLLGAPAGYVGFDAGGGLTNAVKEQPYSLVLLDEIEKAHPKIFDIFLQILDDGRLTSGQGETIDFTQTIIMATSNVGVADIIAGFTQGDDITSETFIRNKLLPALSESFRLEFLNRFDAILVFNPLSEQDLLEVAKLEIQKIEARAAKHNIKFKIDPKVLASKIKDLSDPRFGARPVKRFIETTCEDLITKKLLS